MRKNITLLLIVMFFVSVSTQAGPRINVGVRVGKHTIGYGNTGGYYGYGGRYGSYGYGLGSYGYGNYGHGLGSYSCTSGVKFNLDLVPENQRNFVRRGIVFVDDMDQGMVNRYDGWNNGSLEMLPGVHQVRIEFEDGREFETRIEVFPGRTKSVNIRLPR